MDKVKYRTIKDKNEITVILDDGGIATIREVEEMEEGDGRKATTDYYQDRFTLESLGSDEGIWEEVGKGKMYCEDWDTSFDDPAHIQDALNWLSVQSEFELDETIWPSFEFSGDVDFNKDVSMKARDSFIDSLSEIKDKNSTQVAVNKIFFENQSPYDLDQFLISLCGHSRDTIQSMIEEDGGDYSFAQKVHELMEEEKHGEAGINVFNGTDSFEFGGKELLMCFSGGEDNFKKFTTDAIMAVVNQKNIPSTLATEEPAENDIGAGIKQ